MVGKVGDTSYGCLKGWHGKSDIIMKDLPVSLFFGDDDVKEDDDHHHHHDVTCDNQSVSSLEEKVADNFVKKDVNQILAQTIVFSFLKQKLNREKLENYMIPGVGIKSKHFMVCFFDTENDVLLQSKPVELFEGKSIRTLAVLFLWLTLNYRIFCSGITHEMKEKHSDFIIKLRDDLHIYQDEVMRPVNVPCITQQELYPWAMEPVTSEFRVKPSLRYRNVLT
ncbi:uncharacterized protein LOC132735242 [Ruditapes philippinarum]|uniref:uncharacterized protein LOC132735242 n=1 Tax=Ruditapes philippinarum TaxID=129788 RepID=UPI00295AED31|nr:uncharacterized protein LOC132735242 [Ruditapes philippinarum]